MNDGSAARPGQTHRSGLSQQPCAFPAHGRSPGPILRFLFIRQITAAAEASEIKIDWHSDYWIARLRKSAATQHIIGYSFPLNNAASAQVASDKVAASVVLAASSIPAIPHSIVRFMGLSPSEWAASVLGMTQFPVVIKPLAESGGIDVSRAASLEELSLILAAMARRYRAIAVSPYVQIENEYRAIVLDGAVRFVYRKVRSEQTEGEMPDEHEWRHNLRLGARPELVDHAEAESRLVPLAQQTMAALGLRFAAVDIVTVAGGMSVLEVNSAVTLEHFSHHSPEHNALAARVYSEAVRRCFEDR